MDIEVNEYVRTIEGKIGKIIKYENFEYHIKIDKDEVWKCSEDFIVKHSKQLIDLIEVGDYVNGLEVEQVLKVREFKGFRGSKKFAFTHIKFSLPGGMIEDKEIRTILTKEQYMANCYKVGGEK